MKNYIELALKTETKDYQAISKRYTPEIARLMHASTGLCTEDGELLGDILWYMAIACDVLDMLKKHLNYNKPFDKVNAIEELETSFDQIMEKNIAKLKARYGDKFSNENAINRDLEKERKILDFEYDIGK